MDLRNAMALITGGTSGIGLAIAKVLKEAGAPPDTLHNPIRQSFAATMWLHIVKAFLEMDDRGFTPELSIFATNPKD